MHIRREASRSGWVALLGYGVEAKKHRGLNAALERRPPTGRVLHFELVSYLTKGAFGRVHPLHRAYGQWMQMEEQERWLHRADMADLYLATGFALCSDYCLNARPFLRPSRFAEFVAPYLARLIEAYREMGFYTIKHTDGNILPILDQLLVANYERMLDVWRSEGNYPEAVGS